jgi:hypothetical protein
MAGYIVAKCIISYQNDLANRKMADSRESHARWVYRLGRARVSSTRSGACRLHPLRARMRRARGQSARLTDHLVGLGDGLMGPSP